VTAVLDEPTAPADVAVRLASWPARAAALLIDLVPGVVVAATAVLSAVTAPQHSWTWWVFLVVAGLAVLATLANRTLIPATTGWSLGRAVSGIRVVGRTGSAAGAFRLLLRDFAHLLDTAALFLGWLWPLWDGRHRTFADLLTRTEVHVVPASERDVRKRAGVAMIVAALVCAATAGLGYQQIYRHDRAVQAARQQIAEQGPRIVEQLLSYDHDTVKDDFARAQNLATEGYRGQLMAQQEAVAKAGVVNNEYWAVSSAVIDNDATHAAMLVALQGQRGTEAKDLRFITATVRVDFDKAGDRWQVANLVVLKAPLLNVNSG
jgi:Mce-associated membrane protein